MWRCGDRLCGRVSDAYDGLRLRLTENLKNKAIACCQRVSDYIPKISPRTITPHTPKQRSHSRQFH
ncbi:hypothetical protein [Nostoc sp.]|uniref:hypothetical protein n=1 Tax=Nostoc sp. TaxID=1180 RepID=UPI002FF5BF22